MGLKRGPNYYADDGPTQDGQQESRWSATVKVLLMNGWIFSNTCTFQQSDSDAGRWERLLHCSEEKTNGVNYAI